MLSKLTNEFLNLFEKLEKFNSFVSSSNLDFFGFSSNCEFIILFQLLDHESLSKLISWRPKSLYMLIFPGNESLNFENPSLKYLILCSDLCG